MTSRSAGFTLIELVIVLAIIVLAMLVSVPFTASWVDSARVNETQGLFQQAFSRSKALALRNGSGATVDTAAATLCQNGTTLYLYSGLPATCGAGTIAWQGDIPGGSTAIQLGGATFTCMVLNNLGMLVSSSIGGTNCATASNYTISKGGQSVSKTLF